MSPTKHKNALSINDFDLVLFGGTGDLAMRKLLPALYARDHAKNWPDTAKIICIGRDHRDHDDFIKVLEEKAKPHIPAASLNESCWQRFCNRLQYVALDAHDPKSYSALNDALRHDDHISRVFYLATSYRLYSAISCNLSKTGLATSKSRVVLEKPLGRNLESAKEINAEVGKYFQEEQIYRIDHYLGKEAVQNLLALRFGNVLFEPLWRRDWISDVQITIAEELGVGGRFDYYDTSGALRDMMQNHLLQLLCIIAMEPPVSADANAVRDEKLKVLRSLKRFTPETISKHVVRGQYRAGHVNGKAVPGYREEEDATPESNTETFVALKAEIDTWRWAGVPFYLRTGKRLANSSAEIVIRFKTVPHSIFAQQKGQSRPNSLIIRLQPNEGLHMNLVAKTPGDGMRLQAVELGLDFREKSKTPRMEAYERLLLDVLRGDLTLFMRSDELEAAWSWIEPILERWEHDEDKPIPYRAGTWGPAAASALIGRDGLQWREEDLPEN
jgi:glucose-6-phosphate 1-dehydrogenase